MIITTVLDAVALVCAAVAAAAAQMLTDEVIGWFALAPHGLLRLAALRLPVGLRNAVHGEEWLPELTFILNKAEGRPLTRLIRGIWFAVSMFRAARRVGRTLVGVRDNSQPGAHASESDFQVSESGLQLVTNYMLQVVQAARLLPKGDRMAFVARMRARVDREIGRPGPRTNPKHVAKALERLGKPEDLVAEERIRIDQFWSRNRAVVKEEATPEAEAFPRRPMNRPFIDLTRPNSDTQPLTASSHTQPRTGRPIPPVEGKAAAFTERK